MRREETEGRVEREREEKINEGKETERGKGQEGRRLKTQTSLASIHARQLLHTVNSIFPKEEPKAGHLSGASARACFISSTQQAAGTGGVMLVESRSLLG